MHHVSKQRTLILSAWLSANRLGFLFPAGDRLAPGTFFAMHESCERFYKPSTEQDATLSGSSSLGQAAGPR